MAAGGRRLLLAGLLALLVGCAVAGQVPAGERRAGPLDQPGGPWAQQDHWLPVIQRDGTTRLILARICRPPAPALPRLVVIAHGKSPVPAEIAAYAPPSCGAEAARWFLERGFAVVLPVRRGYGATGGVMAERNPACAPDRDYTVSALEAARDITAAIDYATALPGIAGQGVVVVGQSAGGLGAVALSSLGDPRVTALVSMAGGDGGHLNRVAHAVCQPDALVRAAGRFGATARRPMLWIYTENDSYFAPPLATAMRRAYVAAGGQARLVLLPAWGRDGHLLFSARGGSAVWGRPVAEFLGLKPALPAASMLAPR